MKKFKLLGSVALILCVFLTGCGKTKNIEGSLTDIMDKVYESVKDDMPELENTKLNDDNIEYFLGTSDIDYKEGLASEPFINAIAHSVVLIRMNDGADIEATKTKIKNSVRETFHNLAASSNSVAPSNAEITIAVSTGTGK